MPQQGYRQPGQSEHSRAQGPTSAVNTSQGERLFSMMGGAGFIGAGLVRRGWLGVGLAAIGADLVFRGASGHSLLYRLTGKNRAVVSQSAAVSVPHGAGVRVERTVTINRPPEEVYAFWRDFSNLPVFMENVESVTIHDETHSHWAVKGPAGVTLEWEAAIVSDEPHARIAWRTLANADVDHAGTVHFRPAPGDRGTEVHVVLEYVPIAGAVGSLVAKLFRREPDQQIASDLHHLKQILEAGEIATVDGQPSGRS